MGINEETKPKSIIIDGKLHSQFKMLCKGKSMKIGGVIEDLIRLYLRDPKETQKKIDELKEEESVKSLRSQMFEAITKK
jgi:ERCC4-type nuclease